MRLLRFAIAIGVTVAGWAQTVAPVQLGSSSTEGGFSRVGFDFKLMGDGPDASLPENWKTLRSGFRIGSEPLMPVSSYVYDSPNRVYFGYDLLIEKRQSGAYLVTFGRLSLSPFELVMEIQRNPPVAGTMPLPSMNPADWTLEPLPGYPPPRTVRERETIRIDLFTDKNTGRRIYENFQILPEATVSGVARDFPTADAELKVAQPRVTWNGTLQSTVTRGELNARGLLIWFYLPDHGRYVLSLAPHPDLDFKLAGEVRGGAITFTLSGDSIRLECPNPLASGDSPYNLYVLHDPAWEPTAQAQKGQFAVGSVDRGELAALKRK